MPRKFLPLLIADYRDRVETHQRLSWAGLGGAALGGILIVVAF